MNRVLQQRFNQISRQNNFRLALRQATASRIEWPADKMSTLRAETAPDHRTPERRRASA